MMDSILQQRRITHQDDDFHRWGYEGCHDVLTSSSFSPSNDGEFDMHWDDAVGGFFEEYH
jgi:hypothetical protein